MKRYQFKFLVSVTASLLFFGIGTAALRAEGGKCNVTVVMRGFKSNEGVSMVGLWNKKDKWLENEGRVVGKSGSIKGLKSVVTIQNIPCGKYAIAVFHDANKNGSQDKNMIGIPKEGYGFSGKKEYRFGPLEFNEALISIDQAETRVEIRLNNVM